MPIVRTISSDAVLGRSVWVGNCAQEVFAGDCDPHAVAIAAASWDELEEDAYLSDGGRYRRRRYAELAYDAQADVITDLLAAGLAPDEVAGVMTEVASRRPAVQRSLTESGLLP
jgi:hypothetical protein